MCKYARCYDPLAFCNHSVFSSALDCLIRHSPIRQTLSGSSWGVSGISQRLVIVCEASFRMGCSSPWLDQVGLAHGQSSQAVSACELGPTLGC